MTTRYYEETPCEHGNYPRQCGVSYGSATGNTPLPTCPGGQRRELTGAEVVEAERFGLIGVIARMPKPGRYAIIPLEEPADG